MTTLSLLFPVIWAASWDISLALTHECCSMVHGNHYRGYIHKLTLLMKLKKIWRKSRNLSTTHTSPAGRPRSPGRPQRSWRGWRRSRPHTADRWTSRTPPSPPPGTCTGCWWTRSSPGWSDHWWGTRGRPEGMKTGGVMEWRDTRHTLRAGWMEQHGFVHNVHQGTIKPLYVEPLC